MFAQHAPAPHIYSVAPPTNGLPHNKTHLISLRKSNLTATFTLVNRRCLSRSQIDKIVAAHGVRGPQGHAWGLEPSMSTRYYSPLRAVQQLLPLLNAAPSPRVISVLAGGHEAQMNEADLDLRDSANWSYWNAAVHAATMCTLSLERLACGNPGLSVVHWHPGAVATPGLAKWDKYGLTPPNQRSQDEAALGMFLATSDRWREYCNEGVLAGFRERGVDEVVWSHTEKVWAECAAWAGSPKDKL
ncbi:hypothetical protein B0H14DRAFT_3082489 [Mycena olivaceomarginata]|nr:hypothetical protein B0H14DRAFT_3082489 [Mycena olivaceomarginata]